MTKGKVYPPWPGADERVIVEDMLRDRESKHWEGCSTFIKRYVHIKARNIPYNHQEEIIGEIMYKITKYLPYFHFQCTLKTWLNVLIEHCIIDTHRRLRNEGRFIPQVGDLLNENDREEEEFSTSNAKSAEDIAMINDDLRNALTALLEYANLHSSPIRNRHIIRMVILEGHTQAETAKAVGCNVPVVSYVVREAQRYAREKMGRKP